VTTASQFGYAVGVFALTPHKSTNSAEAQQAAVLAPYAQQTPRYTQAAQQLALVAAEGRTLPYASQVVALVPYRNRPTDDRRVRAFAFHWEGHPFYVLHIGNRGTYALDLRTQQWSNFSTLGFGVMWNAEAGLNWDEEVWCGDSLNPVLWRFDPGSTMDDGFRPVERVVTGLLTLRGRATAKLAGLYLAATVAAEGEVRLRWSDNEGVHFTPDRVIALSGDPTQQIAWRGLGLAKAPGRVFEITDTGGITRIDGADLE